jgi:hypothetical protein
MMKKIFLMNILLFFGFIANAQSMNIPFIPEEFEVNILRYSHMIHIENPHSEHIDTYYTFTDKDKNYQIRYTFFKQTNIDDPNIRISFSFWIMLNIMNIAGHENIRVSNFNDNDVKNEFNGDFGSAAFIQNPTSDFGTGYNYIMVNFFYKNNLGTVVQSILLNDLEFTQNPIFMDIFHSFRFQD